MKSVKKKPEKSNKVNKKPQTLHVKDKNSEKNEEVGLPDVDFKKFLGCGG